MSLSTQTGLVLAQEPAQSGSQEEADTTAVRYVESMDEYLSVKFDANDRIEAFALYANDVSLRLEPNTTVRSNFSVHYRIVSFSFAFNTPFLKGNQDNDSKGKTSSGGLGLELNFSKWMVGGGYHWTYGYYLKNTADVVPGWEEGTDPYLQFPDLFYRQWSGQLGYKFNSRFSFRALSVQTERQLRSTGSFVPSTRFRYYIVDDRTALTGGNSSQRSNNLEVGLVPGYVHTFVLPKSFYIGSGAFAGYGFIHTDLLTRTPAGDFRTKQNAPIFRAQFDIALGYNGPRWFCGGQAQYRFAEYNQEGTTAVVVNDALTWQVFIGYRFIAPRLLRELTDEAEERSNDMLRKIKEPRK